MSHFSDWFNYQASIKILIFSMLAGAALPGLFAVGIRLQAAGSGDISLNGSEGGQRNPALTAAAWVIYGLVVAVILFALLFIAREFIAHHTGYPFLGAKAK
ncbi:hypothetical protein A5714_13415 [Mycobacterium sp. E2462]|uniref:hypothetical protein n=1 Tax=unclassified Mycobacterium TaxID=2642494 RepID=UPI000801FE80|nr:MULTISPECIES: hypothetical protein [unclassified Mycobacterium]OBG73254.1 hypothetical protein A5700_07115 [Mycobacterium sp. E1214]OBH31656.1 hypothetical protein A5693_15585 [Mycobacterium sp. E1319]OBI14507.1 hypothetical protein A5714_13415 [Mycobacterium sp. E2462]